jgi:hypothetical protein
MITNNIINIINAITHKNFKIINSILGKKKECAITYDTYHKLIFTIIINNVLKKKYNEIECLEVFKILCNYKFKIHKFNNIYNILKILKENKLYILHEAIYTSINYIFYYYQLQLESLNNYKYLKKYNDYTEFYNHLNDIIIPYVNSFNDDFFLQAIHIAKKTQKYTITDNTCIEDCDESNNIYTIVSEILNGILDEIDNIQNNKHNIKNYNATAENIKIITNEIICRIENLITYFGIKCIYQINKKNLISYDIFINLTFENKIEVYLNLIENLQKEIKQYLILLTHYKTSYSHYIYATNPLYNYLDFSSDCDE